MMLFYDWMFMLVKIGLESSTINPSLLKLEI